MAGVWKRDGTVAVTNGNKKVTGTGTTFADTKNGVAKGHLFCITSGTSVDVYEVDYVVSNTEIYLVQAYRGVTATGKAYEIITTFSDSVPEFARRLTATLSAYQQQSDAFQALLTSTAATVEVTAPDGTKQTLIPWKRVTSEGEGQAARAKTEADKAAASAALAGDIVAASALPLPDVWAPLSDSLRLLTGFGRDVLVGSDVVARMVDFSRSTTATYIGKDGLLKTAAVNEPRFEKEGLLIEGQSTNLIPTSNFPQNLAGWIAPNSSGNTHAYGLAPDGSNAAMKVAFAGDGLNRGIPELTDGVTYTFSFYAKNENATAVEFLIRIGGSTGSVVFQVPGNTPWRRYQVTQTYKEGDRSLRWYVNTKNVEIWLWGAQIEALPFASSYIPTNGAAVTRGRDVVRLPWARNVSEREITVALNYDVLSILLPQQRLIEYSSPVIPRYLFQVVSDNGGEFHTMAGTNALKVANPSTAYGATAVAATTPTRHALKITGKPITSYVATGPLGATSNIDIGAAANGGSPMYGHIRNLRIWHRALTDDQLKAVA
ncbi:LamG domain-containing protein [Aeromonas sp. FDAARGOS 1418]|uniref:LamG domain-containing protein n=1 Tax=Aeromonas sp. FDAARGOS 1418 TaxID=2778067 RepID=UPI001C22B966|nr:LamG domain-containing protein [Aeromonas sp. FDAARGOS 1418]QXB98610.1 LamG domain-containing protein [Aeromonas sp. FDAARGOS 1418]